MTPSISVIMSVYNGERHVKEAIRSIRFQTFADYEFIIVDDGSTDATGYILAESARQDPRLRLFRNDANWGLTRSLNRGLAHARGNFIARQDADDISHPTRLESQIAFMLRHPEVGAVGAFAKRIDQQNTVNGILGAPTTHGEILAHLLVRNPMVHSSLFARRTTVDRVKGYNPELRYAQDYDLWWRLGREQELACLPECLVDYRSGSQDSISVQHHRQQMDSARLISRQIVGQATGLPESHLESFDRLWWGLRGGELRWESGDTGALNLLWRYLSADPEHQRVWCDWLSGLCGRVAAQNLPEGLHLAWVEQRYLASCLSWPKLVRAWGHRVLPSALLTKHNARRYGKRTNGR